MIPSEAIVRGLDPLLRRYSWSLLPAEDVDWVTWVRGAFWLTVGLRAGRDPSVHYLKLRMGSLDGPDPELGACQADLDAELHPDDLITERNSRTGPSFYRVLEPGELEASLARLRAWLAAEPRVLEADPSLIEATLQGKRDNPALQARWSDEVSARAAAAQAWARGDWPEVVQRLAAISPERRTRTEQLKLARARRLAEE